MPQSSFSHRKQRSWQKLSITIPEHLSDPLASFLAELTGTAIEQSTPISPSGTDPFEVVSVYLEEDNQLIYFTQQIQKFIEALGEQKDLLNTITTETILEEDWNKRWKQHFKPFNLTNRLVIKPSWEEYTPTPNQVVLEMDPGMAFGTGLHASTKLALQLTEDLFKTKQINSVLDVGTGTGILGMSCALFGANTIVGIDNDLDARVAAEDNIRHNKLDKKMSIIDKDLSQISQNFDLVIANITQDVLTLLADSLTARINPGGSLILSGILAGEQSQSIQHIFNTTGLKMTDSNESEEWTALHFSAPQ